MTRILGLIVSSAAIAGGVCGLIWPNLYRSSLEEQFTPTRARVGAVVLVLLGVAGLIAILSYKGGPVEFFPA